MKSICYVHKDIGDIERGGISTLFKTLAVGMRDAGWKVYCITQQDLSIEGIESIKLEKERDPLVYSKKVTEVIQSIKPIIAECSTWRFELLDYLNTDNRETKVVVRCEPAAEIFFDNMDTYSAGERALCAKADLRVAVSNFAKEIIEEKYDVKVESVVHNGVDVTNLRALISNDSRNAISKDKINIFWCGKATKMKGYDYLENIIKYSDLSKLNWIINLGNSPEEVVWDKETKGSVSFVSNIAKEEQISIWSKCDVSISTSRNEGFGLVVAESLALGVPVILNKDCVVFQEFLPNSAVKLVDVRNTQEVLNVINSIQKLKQDKSLLTSNFNKEEMLTKSIKEYTKLIS